MFLKSSLSGRKTLDIKLPVSLCTVKFFKQGQTITQESPWPGSEGCPGSWCSWWSCRCCWSPRSACVQHQCHHTLQEWPNKNADFTDWQIAQCKGPEVFISVDLSGRDHCRARTASGLLSPPPSCLEDKRSHRSYRPPRNELQWERKELLINIRRDEESVVVLKNQWHVRSSMFAVSGVVEVLYVTFY